jgi:hypothetical protein
MIESQPQTAPTQKMEFRVPNTVLWLMKVDFFKFSYMVIDTLS